MVPCEDHSGMFDWKLLNTTDANKSSGQLCGPNPVGLYYVRFNK